MSNNKIKISLIILFSFIVLLSLGYYSFNNYSKTTQKVLVNKYEFTNQINENIKQNNVISSEFNERQALTTSLVNQINYIFFYQYDNFFTFLKEQNHSDFINTRVDNDMFIPPTPTVSVSLLDGSKIKMYFTYDEKNLSKKVKIDNISQQLCNKLHKSYSINRNVDVIKTIDVFNLFDNKVCDDIESNSITIIKTNKDIDYKQSILDIETLLNKNYSINKNIYFYKNNIDNHIISKYDIDYAVNEKNNTVSMFFEKEIDCNTILYNVNKNIDYYIINQTNELFYIENSEPVNTENKQCKNNNIIVFSKK